MLCHLNDEFVHSFVFFFLFVFQRYEWILRHSNRLGVSIEILAHFQIKLWQSLRLNFIKSCGIADSHLGAFPFYPQMETVRLFRRICNIEFCLEILIRITSICRCVLWIIHKSIIIFANCSSWVKKKK